MLQIDFAGVFSKPYLLPFLVLTSLFLQCTLFNASGIQNTSNNEILYKYHKTGYK